MTEESEAIRVLVIDDSMELFGLVERILVPHGYKVIQAQERHTGLEKAITQAPDLILLDYELSDQGGRKFLEELRARPLQIPIVLMITGGCKMLPVQILRMGVRDCVAKPLTPEELLRTLQGATFEIELRRQKAALTQQVAQVKEQWQASLTELNTFYRIGQSIVSFLPLEELLDRVIEAVLYLTQAEECTLALKDPKTGKPLEKVSKRQTKGDVRPLPAAPFGAGTRPSTTAAMLYVPLKAGSKQVGVLRVSNKDLPRPFSQRDKRILNILADYVAIALENRRLAFRRDEPSGGDEPDDMVKTNREGQ
jgi:two-component system NtrC family sensor kinase